MRQDELPTEFDYEILLERCAGRAPKTRIAIQAGATARQAEVVLRRTLDRARREGLHLYDPQLGRRIVPTQRRATAGWLAEVHCFREEVRRLLPLLKRRMACARLR